MGHESPPESLPKRVAALEEESHQNAERYAVIQMDLRRLVVAISGDPQNDILGVIGRMKLQDAAIAALTARVVAVETEWNIAKQQVVGASKVGRILWAFIGAGGGVILIKVFQLLSHS